MQVKNMNLIMENWRNFNNNKDLMLVEVEFNKILEEEQAILDDFEELMEHYRSGGILLENKKVAILEKKEFCVRLSSGFILEEYSSA